MALVRRLFGPALAVAMALAAIGADAPIEKGNMLLSFVRVLDAMVYAAVGLCLFAVVWAGVLLMGEGADDRGAGRARASVALGVMGLVLTLSARGIVLVLVKVVDPTP